MVKSSWQRIGEDGTTANPFRKSKRDADWRSTFVTDRNIVFGEKRITEKKKKLNRRKPRIETEKEKNKKQNEEIFVLLTHF